MWQALIPIVGNLLDKVLPDPAAATAAKLKMMEMAQAGELAQLTADTDLAKGQLAVNAVEAANPSAFISGWRPFIGWVCGAAFAWNFIGLPVAMFAAAYFGKPIHLAPADISEMLPVLLGMLGLGGLRTFEKSKGVAR